MKASAISVARVELLHPCAVGIVTSGIIVNQRVTTVSLPREGGSGGPFHDAPWKMSTEDEEEDTLKRRPVTSSPDANFSSSFHVFSRGFSASGRALLSLHRPLQLSIPRAVVV